MNKKTVFIIGLILGSLSWAICPIISDKFEPFDTEIGFYTGQIMMSLFTIYIGLTASYKNLLIALFGIYLSQNIYAYIFGGTESRNWAALGLFSIIALCIYPLIAGLIAKLVKFIDIKTSHRK